jgi:hypothetical protein
MPKLLESRNKQMKNNYDVIRQTVTDLGMEHIPVDIGFVVMVKKPVGLNGDILQILNDIHNDVGVQIKLESFEGEGPNGWFSIKIDLAEERIKEGMARFKVALGPLLKPERD